MAPSGVSTKISESRIRIGSKSVWILIRGIRLSSPSLESVSEKLKIVVGTPLNMLVTFLFLMLGCLKTINLTLAGIVQVTSVTVTPHNSLCDLSDRIDLWRYNRTYVVT